jgi:hypothetical protein
MVLMGSRRIVIYLFFYLYFKKTTYAIQRLLSKGQILNFFFDIILVNIDISILFRKYIVGKGEPKRSTIIIILEHILRAHMSICKW